MALEMASVNAAPAARALMLSRAVPGYTAKVLVPLVFLMVISRSTRGAARAGSLTPVAATAVSQSTTDAVNGIGAAVDNVAPSGVTAVLALIDAPLMLVIPPNNSLLDAVFAVGAAEPSDASA